MICNVFRSDKKKETFLYLARGTEFEDLPVELQNLFGQPQPVMSLVLSPKRKLAQVDVNMVIENLQNNGYFLQLPSKTPTEEEISRWLSR
jgi:uncharacterized protein YcgL (UPF0745 family)